jgi:hypothetical protein
MDGLRLSERPTIGRAELPPWTPSPSADLRARLASGTATAGALAPLIADVVAVHREATAGLAAAAPADVDIVDFDRAWRWFMAESGALVNELGDLIVSACGPADADLMVTRTGD